MMSNDTETTAGAAFSSNRGFVFVSFYNSKRFWFNFALDNVSLLYSTSPDIPLFSINP